MKDVLALFPLRCLTIKTCTVLKLRLGNSYLQNNYSLNAEGDNEMDCSNRQIKHNIYSKPKLDLTFGIEKKLPSWSASPPGKILLMKIPLTSLPSRLHPPQILMPEKKKKKICQNIICKFVLHVRELLS